MLTSGRGGSGRVAGRVVGRWGDGCDTWPRSTGSGRGRTVSGPTGPRGPSPLPCSRDSGGACGGPCEGPWGWAVRLPGGSAGLPWPGVPLSTCPPAAGPGRDAEGRGSAFGAPTGRWCTGCWWLGRGEGLRFDGSLSAGCVLSGCAGCGRVAGAWVPASGAPARPRAACRSGDAGAPGSGVFAGCSARDSFPAHSKEPSATRTHTATTRPRSRTAGPSEPPSGSAKRSILL